MKAGEASAPIELLSLPRAMVHQRDENEVEQSGVKNQDEVVRIPPAVKSVGGNQQPWNPEPRAPQGKKHRQHNRHEDQECPGVEKHR